MFGSTATTPQSVMNYCVIKYSGDPGANGGSGAIVIDGRVNPAISNIVMYNNTLNGIELITGTYSQNVNLNLTSLPYILQGSPTIASGASLIVQPGVVIKSGLNVVIYIDGILKSLGTIGQHVIFTSLKDDTRYGDM